MSDNGCKDMRELAIGLARLRGTGSPEVMTGTPLDLSARDDDQDSSRSGNGFCSVHVVAGEAGLYLYIVRSSRVGPREKHAK